MSVPPSSGRAGCHPQEPAGATSCPEARGATLAGTEHIGEYFRSGVARYTALHFEILTITESADRSVVEYRRHSPGDGASPPHVLKLIERRGPRIRAVRVYHGQ